MTAEQLIVQLGLAPHPEGGHFRETWRAPAASGQRAAGTAIYFLLARGEVSAWHRIDATELWHFYAGDPLELAISEDGHSRQIEKLGADLAAGQQPQRIVAQGAWQSARTTGDWTLVGCTVSPAFEFAGFELAPADFAPGR